MLSYFTAEKRESLLFMAVGIAAIVASILLYRASSPFRGMMIPLVLVGLIQIGVGGSVFFRTDQQIADLTAQLDKDPAGLVKAEIPRMDKVMTNFTVYKTVEIALLALGIALTFLYRGRDFPYSAGIGLILQASLMLVLDLFAEHRGEIYLEQLRKLGGGGG